MIGTVTGTVIQKFVDNRDLAFKRLRTTGLGDNGEGGAKNCPKLRDLIFAQTPMVQNIY
jgi:hypothetical protein